MEINEATRAALGEFYGLSFTAGQVRELELAQAADPEAFERLVEHARTAPNPAASIILGSRNISVRTDETQAAKLRGEAGKSEKRVRSALSYSRSALGRAANEAQLEDERSLEHGASAPIPQPAHDWPMPRNAYAAKFWSDPKHWIAEAGARWCDLPDGHPMKHPLDMEISITE